MPNTPVLAGLLAAWALLAIVSSPRSPTCVTTDPLIVLGYPILPSMTQCVPPQ